MKNGIKNYLLFLFLDLISVIALKKEVNDCKPDFALIFLDVEFFVFVIVCVLLLAGSGQNSILCFGGDGWNAILCFCIQIQIRNNNHCYLYDFFLEYFLTIVYLSMSFSIV